VTLVSLTALFFFFSRRSVEEVEDDGPFLSPSLLPCLALSCRVASRRVASCRVVLCRVASCRVASRRVVSRRVVSRLVSSRLASKKKDRLSSSLNSILLLLCSSDDEVTPDPLDAYKSSLGTPGETPGKTAAGTPKTVSSDNEQRGGFGANATSSMAEEKKPLSLKERSEQTNKDAIQKHKQKDYEGAIQSYGKAIQLSTTAGGRVDDLKVMYNNRAASFQQVGNLPSAEADCNKAIAMDNKYMKARKRRATIRTELGKQEEALVDFYAVCLMQMGKDANNPDMEVNAKIESLLKSISASKAKDAWEARKERIADGKESLRWPSSHVMRFQLEQQQSSTADATAAMKKAAKAKGEDIVEVPNMASTSSIPQLTAAITLARSKGESEAVSKKVALLYYLRSKAHIKRNGWEEAKKDLEASIAASTTGFYTTLTTCFGTAVYR
jgi:tetratricopeptide (TPR) repeat protein